MSRTSEGRCRAGLMVTQLVIRVSDGVVQSWTDGAAADEYEQSRKVQGWTDELAANEQGL